MAQRQCLKCDHINTSADGGALEACPSCGAIYSRVEAAQAHQSDGNSAVRRHEAQPGAWRQVLLWAGVLAIVMAGYGLLRHHNAKAEQESRARTELFQRQEVERQARQQADETQAHQQRVADAIAQKKVFAGMTAAQATESWGEPHNVNASVGSFGKHEQWVYYRNGLPRQYIYIENGVVRSMQTTQAAY